MRIEPAFANGALIWLIRPKALRYSRRVCPFKHPLSNLAKRFAGRGPKQDRGDRFVIDRRHRRDRALSIPAGNGSAGNSNHDPKWMIDVLNRGKGGEEAPPELERFDTDVIAEGHRW